MPGGMVSNISWRFLKFWSRKHHRVAPRPRNHPSTPMERNLLLQIHNDQLIGITFDASEMMSFALFAASGPSHVLKIARKRVSWWLPFSFFWGGVYLVVCFSKLKGWGGVKKGHFIGLHVLNRCLVQSFKKRVFQRMNNSQSKKKSSRCFEEKRSSWKSSNLLWLSPSTSPSTSPSSFPGAGEFSNSNSCNPSKSLQKNTKQVSFWKKERISTKTTWKFRNHLRISKARIN